ncbi:MAG TPA: Maf family nucleotide pyrophosphatase [Stellaceae bacterium]|nr:Maf family nucleotide pyrophosphatase [Stellaceae bacterium]
MKLGARLPLVLASQSAARRTLLAAAGINVKIVPARIDEGEIKNVFRSQRQPVDHCARGLAAAKATHVSAFHPTAWVIGADQILECGGEWLDKATDLDDARRQLRLLRGRAHELVTAVAVAGNGVFAWHHVERARLTMRAFSDAFLDDYIAAQGKRLLATVGGYALEGLGAQLFERIEGDYFAILGLPLLPLLGFLREQGAVAR